MTVTNAGTLASQIIAVSGLGGSLTNLTGGVISGKTSVRLGSTPSTFTNQANATIIATGGTGVSQYYGTGFNAGTITGFDYAVLKRTGALTNQSGGQLVGDRFGVQIGAGSIVNEATAIGCATVRW